MANQFLGLADTATTLATARTIFGNPFNGSADVAGRATVYGNGADTGRYISGGIQVRESALVGGTQSSDRYAPRIGFHWATRQGSNLIMTSDGNFKFTDGEDSGYRNVTAGTFIGALSGNATSATTATTAATATQANKLTTARTITIAGNGNGATNFDGSGNVSINLVNDYAAASGLVNIHDTRNVNTAPSGYGLVMDVEFKQCSVIGLNSAYYSGTYGTLTTVKSWSDNSGGNAYQMLYANKGDGVPYLYTRTAEVMAASWSNDWQYMLSMNQTGGYWGFNFPTADTYLRVPPEGLLPNSRNGTVGVSTIGTSGWPFVSMYAKKFYGNLEGNADTATKADNATYAASAGSANTASSANRATSSGYSDMVLGIYTGSGGNQPPSYIPKARVRFNMMRGLTGLAENGFSGYCDCMLMDTYSGGDVPISTGFGIARVAGAPRAWIFNGPQGGAAWSAYAELITSSNIGAQSVAGAANASALGGVAAASYINTSDTLVLRGVV